MLDELEHAMLDRYLEPDVSIEYTDDTNECCHDEPTEEEIRIAEFNYECMVYNELDRRIWR